MDMNFSAEDHFQRGRAALEADQLVEALENFRSAHRLDPVSPRFRSYCGLVVGLKERRFDKALELCRSAAKEEFYNPELYYNLAQVHLAFGFKSEALRYLRRALMIAPDHEPTLTEMGRLGARRRPTLGFLRRGNLLNRLLGRVLSWARAGHSQPELLPRS
jgi:tetratricopeptide (TPR) repeat protein